MARLFVSQDRLDKWTVEGKVSLEGDVMTLPALGRSFRLRPALFVAKVVTGDDTQGLLGRVKTEEQLAKLGADTFQNSVVLGETAYECEIGFVGEVLNGTISGAERLGS